VTDHFAVGCAAGGECNGSNRKEEGWSERIDITPYSDY
jgi:hypothetical protein